MSPVRRIAMTFSLLLAAAGALVEYRFAGTQQRELTVRQSELTRIESLLREQQHLLAKTTGEYAEVEREVTRVRQTQALAEAGSSITLWANRITLLKRLLEDMPGQSIPEIRLLAPIDWVQVVRTTELDSSENLRTALSAVRVTGRKKFSEKLQEALRRFTTATGGEIPADIGQLETFLTAPADAEMLQRYALTRTGRLGAADEILIKEKPIADMILAVGLDTWNITLNKDWNVLAAEVDSGEFTRSMAAFSVAFDNNPGAKELAEMLSPKVWVKLGERLKPQFESTFGEAFGDEVKLAVKRYSADRAGELPGNVADLLPYLKDAEKLVPVLRPILAEFEYMRDHQGKLPSDPAQVQPYLDKPFNPADVLRAIKITVEGDTVTATFGLSWGTP